MPLPRPQHAHSPPLPATLKKTPPRPKPRRRKKLSTSITTLNSFERVTLDIDKLLQRYLDSPRRNYRTLPSDLRDLVSSEHSDRLHPCNANARIRFAGIVQRQIVRFGIPAMRPLNWVTIAPGRFAVPIEHAQNYDLRPLIGCIRQAFGGVPFLAFIEAAHYRPSRGLGPYRGDVISWHVHAITWGVSTVDLIKRLKPFKARHVNMVGRSCVHIKPIMPDDVLQKALYGSKGQIKSYRHFLQRETEIDPETGEIMHKLAQGKERIRTGDLVRMVEVFDRMRIDDLVFGNGLGTDLANVIRYKVMRPRCRWAKREIAKGRERPSDLPFVAKYQALGNQLRRKLGVHALGKGPMRLDNRLGLRRLSTLAENRSKRF